MPTIEDRIIQQCIKQVLEPICEAKFHPHSYGFRPNRSTKHAVARANFLMWSNGLHYVVDIDLKSFFDNVNHGKLIKQMWTIGIRDKGLICIISKMLKAEIEGIGKPDKGTPQGGILSPLFSNIVLNELDWWISNQWETFKTNHKYSGHNKNTALGKSNLKEIYLVRYADDFKIFCRDYKTAQKIFIATRKWLKERLGLEINTDKSKITNLRRNYTEFLGVKIKVKIKGKRYVSISSLTDKSTKKCTNKLKDFIKRMQHEKKPNVDSVVKFNSIILGLQNYYSMATRVNKDFSGIAFIVNRCLYNRLKNQISISEGIKSRFFKSMYGRYSKGTGIYNLRGICTFPIAGVVYRPARNFSQEICNYTECGREKIHKNLEKCDMNTLRYIMRNPCISQSAEYNDNRISLYAGQNGLCAITKTKLTIGNMEVHHVIPKCMGGSDEYKNLIFVTADVHKLIHASYGKIISKYIDRIKPSKSILESINKYRNRIGNSNIVI